MGVYFQRKEPVHFQKRTLKSSGKKSFFRSKKILILILFLFILLSFWGINSSIFKIQAVDIKKDNINCTDDDQIKKETNMQGSNIFTIDDKKIEVNLKNKFICIKKTLINRIFPSKVNLEVIGRRPAVILINLKQEEASTASLLDNFATPSAKEVENGEKFLVDEEGVVFSRVDILEENIPQLFFSNQKIVLGETVKGEILKNSLLILEKTKNLGLNISKVKISEDKFLIIDSKVRIVFDLTDQVDVQLASLQLILQKAKIESNDLEFIDLRFDKPIIKVAPKKNG